MDLTQAESHFAFGQNWAAYAERVTEAEIREAEQGLSRLVGGRLDGQRFLDIGCGSGLHSLAALRLGAREVFAVDLDGESVATAHAMLARHASAKNVWRVEEISVFV
ncbi:50S ribosomal protein L11 methyltransferase [Pelomicrobium sp.]|uniref:50S ribosomal protein L11 methyltransferase n=1 Tax=Pelomicrobium sp. TaxID=2815319 RepID=UPI002FDCB268